MAPKAPVSRNGQGAATYAGGGSTASGRAGALCARAVRTILVACVAAIASLLMLASLSFLATDTFTFGLELPSFRKIQHVYLDPNREMRTFAPKELRRYDGSDPSLPIYLAVNGRVYDVTNGRRFYGPGGSYAFFAGRDASRNFVTGCFHEDKLTHDTRGLSSDELDGISRWAQFYDNSKKYFHVGYVEHDPIPDDAPLPLGCNKAETHERRL